MLDAETVLAGLDVAVDEFCKAHLSARPRPGPPPSPTPSEVVTLALCGQWARFPAAAACSRHAATHRRPRCPTLPSRAQLNRLVRRQHAALTAFALHLGQALAAGDRAFEAVDGTGLPTRNAKRRGAGWRAGLADIGWCARPGWSEGGRLLLAVTPAGAVTGWGIGPASANDRLLAATFFAQRAAPVPALAGVGRPTSDRDVADLGVSGQGGAARWAADHGAVVGCPPRTGSKRAWPQPRKTWLGGLRQGVEAVNDRLLFACGLERERPHALAGLLARRAAAGGRHNACCWLNRTFGRGALELADLLDW